MVVQVAKDGGALSKIVQKIQLFFGLLLFPNIIALEKKSSLNCLKSPNLITLKATYIKLLTLVPTILL